MYGYIKIIEHSCNVTVNGDKLEQVDQFSYLGSLITQGSRCNKEIKRRVRISKKTFSQHVEGTDITINKCMHENAIAEVLRVVHFIVWM